MNYIKQLEADKVALEQKIAALVSGIQELKEYVSSPKFHCGDPLDGYVSTQDVITRLANMEREG
jgi:hypothetical protein